MLFIYYFWKQPQSSSVQEWLNKQWYVHSNEYYASVKTNDEGLCVLIWSNLQDILLSGKKKVQNSVDSMLPIL